MAPYNNIILFGLEPAPIAIGDGFSVRCSTSCPDNYRGWHLLLKVVQIYTNFSVDKTISKKNSFFGFKTQKTGITILKTRISSFIFTAFFKNYFRLSYFVFI